ncbi:MAG: molybdopterin-guanine dinucleotide biosynthesis protein MobB [Hyphomonadaceae bacterium]|nr:molybdopterin-guanine dinucleotide biosynthesis protein MobB [Hyphomonadaceae bacterium]
MKMQAHSSVVNETGLLVAELDRQALAERLQAAKTAFATRRVDLREVRELIREGAPRTGDLILATINEIGHHSRLELTSGRRAQLYPGDEVIVAYGARYAPDQFEAVVPNDLSACDLAAAGGIAARVVARHAHAKKATTLTPVGMLAGEDGAPLNLSRYALPAPAIVGPARNVICVVGTAMNAGKTTLAASLIHGLSKGGVRVGACKVTGTGAGCDMWAVKDAGAVVALDFTDMGYATTAGLPPATVDKIAHSLVTQVEAQDVDMVVVEIADGLLQRETATLLSPPSTFSARLDSVMLAAADAMGAVAGAEWLRKRNLPLSVISGVVTSSPLAMREAEAATGLSLAPTKMFTDPDHAARLCLARARTTASAAA